MLFLQSIQKKALFNSLGLIIAMFCTSSVLVVNAQPQDTFVKVYGKVLNEKDSSTISASVTYEKLPYYDDIGVTTSGVDGEFEFYLIEGEKYSFTTTKDGYKEGSIEVTVEDPDGDGLFVFSMTMEPGAASEVITLHDLIFARGRDEITESSHQELDELIQWMKDRPKTVIQLEGHTDFAGNAAANLRLSQARVEAVKNYLVKGGVKKNRVYTKAFGGTQPLTTERTPEAKAKNRRVEVRVIAN